MVDVHAKDLQAGIPDKLKTSTRLPTVADGHGAAIAVLQLMSRAATAIPPEALVDAYIAAGGGKSRHHRTRHGDERRRTRPSGAPR